eukprot:TRINITY_DN2068_c0_g1_i2.p1 TRINITY_DN2068_c0_g1~~TRINITY_DN2068_c0_g1_i2.p1  ORF type:complete len:206 (+),score=54.65 TRINITY_DN2068_c0_g1_i2:218-835(+)
MYCSQFDILNIDHLLLMETLWDAFFDEVDFPGEKDINSDTWKMLGFQSSDPRKDIRAGGMFGVMNIVYFMEHYPAACLRIFDNVDVDYDDDHFYPFAIAQFNLTMMIFELVGFGWRVPGKSTAKSKKAFKAMVSILEGDNATVLEAMNEMYCLASYLMDQTWMEGDYSYLDFNQVLIECQDIFEATIKNINTLEELKEYLAGILN